MNSFSYKYIILKFITKSYLVCEIEKVYNYLNFY